jgi:hypothetical protein
MCHNDINPKNCLADDLHFWVIDWEYAGLGDGLFDIALIFSSHNLTPVQQTLFLQHYDEALDLNVIKEDLANYQLLYKMREMAWLLLKHISTPQDVEAIQCYHAFKQEVLEDIEQGRGRPEDLDTLAFQVNYIGAMGNTHCALAPGAMEPLQSALKYFREDFDRHISDGYCPYGGANKMAAHHHSSAMLVGATDSTAASPDAEGVQ